MQYMDYSISKELREYARDTYLMMQGRPPSSAKVFESARALNDNVLHTWQQASFQSNSTVNLFTKVCQQLDRYVGILSQWSDSFDQRGYPVSDEACFGFVRDCMHAFRHYPCLDLPIVSMRTRVLRDDIHDFVTTHPVAVDYYSYYFVSEGNVQIRAESVEFSIGAGSFMLIPPTYGCQLERAPNSESTIIYSGYFKCPSDWFDLVSWSHQSFPHIVEVDAELQEILKTSLTELIYSTGSVDSLNERLAFTLMESVLIRIRKIAFDPEKNNKDRVARGVNYLLHRLDENPSIEELANQVNMSASHFSKLFRDTMGVSVVRWRDAARMEKARDMLRYTELSIAEIGRQIGYNDQLYFTRRFHKIVGLSPSEYRNQHHLSNQK